MFFDALWSLVSRVRGAVTESLSGSTSTCLWNKTAHLFIRSHVRLVTLCATLWKVQAGAVARWIRALQANSTSGCGSYSSGCCLPAFLYFTLPVSLDPGTSTVTSSLFELFQRHLSLFFPRITYSLQLAGIPELFSFFFFSFFSCEQLTTNPLFHFWQAWNSLWFFIVVLSKNSDGCHIFQAEKQTFKLTVTHFLDHLKSFFW